MTPTESGMRIALISYFLPSGSKIGVGYQVHSLANALADRGHCVTVFSVTGPSAGARYQTETLPVSGRNRTVRFAWRMRRQDWTEFDVIHAHSSDYALVGRRLPVRVRTLHGSCLSEARWAQGFRERARMLCFGCTEIVASLSADRAVAVSENTRRWLPWVRCVVPNGVDLTRFQAGERSKVPSLLFVGTYERRKRGKLLSDIFERDVRPAMPDAELWMVCEDAPERPGVTVFGRVSDDALAALYASAWAFCLPSTYEGFGIPYAEAMAASCPVVATPNPGALEITDNGRYGVIATDLELGAALLRILKSPLERERIARRAAAHVQRYDMLNVVRQYEAIYARLIQRRALSK